MYLFFVKFSNVYEHKLTSEYIFIRLQILYYIICTCKNPGYVMMCALKDGVGCVRNGILAHCPVHGAYCLLIFKE